MKPFCLYKEEYRSPCRLLEIAGTKILSRDDWKDIEIELRKAQKKTLKKLVGS